MTMDEYMLELERKMEERNVPEEDREEVRKFAKFLKLKKDNQPIPKDIMDYMLGHDVQNPNQPSGLPNLKT